METLTLELPAMYGDHHVVEVHAILQGLPSVGRVYASAAWHRLELEFDPNQTSLAQIEAALATRGYSPGDGDFPPVAARTRSVTQFSLGPAGAEMFAERLSVPAGPGGPCPGFEVRQPGHSHPADR